jgi:OLD-like protein
VETVVLVEGVSDQVAVETLAVRTGRDLAAEGVSVLPMGGATNIAAFIEQLRLTDRDVRMVGLCDEREERYFRRQLEHVCVCVADLEDELIRALGTAAVERVIDDQGELGSLRIMQKQPDQQGRTVEQQLRRFMGTRSGRKIHYARVLVQALELSRVPRPLQQLLTQI